MQARGALQPVDTAEPFIDGYLAYLLARRLLPRYAVIIDKDTPTLRQTYEAGDWIVIDYAG